MNFWKAFPKSVSDFKRHPWLHGLSVLTISIALLILGLFFICYSNIIGMTDQMTPRSLGSAYLDSQLTQETIESLRHQINSLNGVRSVQYRSKNAVLEEIGTSYGDSALSSSDLEDLFPDVLEIRFVDEIAAADIENLSKEIASLDGVSDVDFSPGWFTQIDRIKKVLFYLGIVLLVSLSLGCAILIANFMGMRHQSRQKDIKVAFLMGASKRYVFLPFLCESLIEGVLGVIIALGGLILFKGLTSSALITSWLEPLGITQIDFLSGVQIGLLLLIGVLMSVMGGATVYLRIHRATHA